ncbi:MAG: hypothetical protein AVDCRST_MAG93-7815, partial [uncultured Chloroflexia bacterium]
HAAPYPTRTSLVRVGYTNCGRAPYRHAGRLVSPSGIPRRRSHPRRATAGAPIAAGAPPPSRDAGCVNPADTRVTAGVGMVEGIVGSAVSTSNSL